MEILAKLNEEINAINKLDPNPQEALYKWIDKECGIPRNAPMGGMLTPIDALPVYLDNKAECHATSIPQLEAMLRLLCVRGLKAVLCGMVKYNTDTGMVLEAVPLRAYLAWDDKAYAGLKSKMIRAYHRAREGKAD